MKPHQTLADDMPSVGDCRQEGKAQVKEDSFQNAVGFSAWNGSRFQEPKALIRTSAPSILQFS
jgi:hypothetical protein